MMNSGLEAIISAWKKSMEGLGLIDAEPTKTIYIAGKSPAIRITNLNLMKPKASWNPMDIS
mgnify:CR=1 FL=1